MKALSEARDLEDGRRAPEPDAKLSAVPASIRTFTQVFDDYRELGLSRPAEMLWAELNRLWNRKQPIYDPGLATLAKRTRYSQRSVERALSELGADRVCLRCAREHPLVLVQKKGRGHNGTIRQFTCMLADERLRTGRAVPRAPRSSNRADPLLLDITRQNGVSSIKITRQNDGSSANIDRQIDNRSADITRQNGGAITTETFLETQATADGAVAADPAETEKGAAVAELVAIGVDAVKARRLVASFGAAVCREQVDAIERRRRRGRPIDNPAGMIIAAIERGWRIAPAIADVGTRPERQPAPGVIDDLRRRLEEGRKPDAAWLRNAGIPCDVYAKIEREVSERAEETRPSQPLCDALETSDPHRYAAEMERIYVDLKPPVWASAGGWRHAIFFSRCRALLEAELARGAVAQ